MFKPYIYKIAIRYFFSKDKKTIVNRINGFAFFMIVSAACTLLLVLSGFAGLKDFGLTYTPFSLFCLWVYILTIKMPKNKFDDKICPVCNRPFEWRKKWKKDWDNVKYCSKRCRMNKSS